MRMLLFQRYKSYFIFRIGINFCGRLLITVNRYALNNSILRSADVIIAKRFFSDLRFRAEYSDRSQ